MVVYRDKPVEVIKEVLVDKIVEVVKEVPREIVKEVQVTKVEEVIKEVEVERIVEVEKFIDRPAPAHAGPAHLRPRASSDTHGFGLAGWSSGRDL